MNESSDIRDNADPRPPWQGRVNALTYGVWGNALLTDEAVAGRAEEVIEHHTGSHPVEAYYRAAVDALASGRPHLTEYDDSNDAVVRDYLVRLVRALDERRPWPTSPSDNSMNFIALAVTAGAAGQPGTTTAAVTDAYNTLRELIGSRYPGVDLQSVENTPAWESARFTVAAALAESGAEGDAELLSAAEELYEVALAHPAVDRTTAILYEAMLAGSEVASGTDHPNTLDLCHQLAYTYHYLGEFDRAIALFEPTLVTRERVLGPGHPHTILTRIALANCYRDMGRIDDAIPLDAAVLADRDRRLGPAHPDSIAHRDHVAAAYESAGRFTEALGLYETTVRIRRQELGPDHPETLVTHRYIARTYESAGRVEEAVTAHETALAEYERALGSDHIHTIVVRYGLARAFAAAGRLDEAIASHIDAIDEYTRVAGPDHPDPHAMRYSLAEVLESAGRIEEACRAYADTAAGYARLLAPDDQALLGVQIGLARATVTLRENALGPEHSDTLDARCDLAHAYAAAGRTDEAVTTCEHALAQSIRWYGARHDTTERLRDRLTALIRSSR